jgi:hypothetical protein
MFEKFYEDEGGAHYHEGESEEEESEEEMEGGRVDFLRRNVGAGYSGNAMDFSLYQPGRSKKVAAVSKRASKMAHGGALSYGSQEHRMKAQRAAGKPSGFHSEIMPSKSSLESAEGRVEERGSGMLSEHAMDLLKMARKGKGKLECIHHEEGEGTVVKHKRRGKGFKEGVNESKKAFDALGDVAISGYDAYEKSAKGDLYGAIDSTRGILDSGFKLKEHATKAADEFRTVGAGKKSSKRGELVKKIMREKGLSLPQASKYVKEHNLYRG